MRDKFILMVFPAVVVALVWWDWMRPSARAATLDTAVEAARKSAPEAAIASRDREKEAALSLDLKQLHEQLRQQLQKWQGLRSTLGNGSDRSAILEQVAHAFRQHGITILDEHPLDTNNQNTDSRWVEQLQRKLQQPLEVTFPELKGLAELKAFVESSASSPAGAAANNLDVQRAMWEVEFVGSYEDVRKAIEAIAGELEVVPMQLRMAEATPQLKLRRWTLVVLL